MPGQMGEIGGKEFERSKEFFSKNKMSERRREGVGRVVKFLQQAEVSEGGGVYFDWLFAVSNCQVGDVAVGRKFQIGKMLVFSSEMGE